MPLLCVCKANDMMVAGIKKHMRKYCIYGKGKKSTRVDLILNHIASEKIP